MIRLAFALVLLCHVAPATAQVERNNSPARPLPAGIQFVDQSKNDPRLKGCRTPSGFKLEIVAEQPTISSPVGMTFAPDGTLYVIELTPNADKPVETVETIRYRDGTTRPFTTLRKKGAIRRLNWNPQKNVYDKAETVIEDESPSSILIHDNWLYAASRGRVQRWKLADAKAKPEIVLQGLCDYGDRPAAGLTVGPDGWLYVSARDGDHFVEGRDGSRANVLRTGAIFRCRPDGSKLHLYSIGYCNPCGSLAFDIAGHAFHIDNGIDGDSKFGSCRLVHVAEESDFGWRLLAGARSNQPDPARVATFGELPGKLMPLIKTGRGATAGLLMYNAAQLPTFYRGLLYLPDAERKSIRGYRIAPRASTFEITHEFELLTCHDLPFFPRQMATGPDGAIYICDSRAGLGKENAARIWRLSWAGGSVPGEDEPVAKIALCERDSWKKLAGPDAALDSLRESLQSADGIVRLLAQRELLRRTEASATPLRDYLSKVVDDEQQPFATRIAGIQSLAQVWDESVRKQFLGWLGDRDSDIRRFAADGLSANCVAGDREAHDALVKSLNDPDLAARRAIALAIGRINSEGAADAIVNLLKFDDGNDACLTDGYVRALERTGSAGMVRLMELFLSGSTTDQAIVVSTFLKLRTRAGAEALPALLRDTRYVKGEMRESLIRSYVNYQFDPPWALEPLIELHEKFKDAAPARTVVEVLTVCGQLKGARAINLVTSLLDDASPEIRMFAVAHIEKGRLGDAAPRLVQALAVEGRGAEERIAIIRALRELKDRDAQPILTSILKSEAPAGLRVEALRSLGSIDPGAAAPIARAFLEQPDLKLQAEAVRVIGKSREGAKLVGEWFIQHKLPRDLQHDVGETLRMHADKDPALQKLLEEVSRQKPK